MSNESNININNSFNKEINSKIHQVTHQDLILFKDELLKDLRDYKTKMSKNINSELEKYIRLIENSNQKLMNYEKDKLNFMTKIDFTQEKEKLFYEVLNKNSELKNQVMINQVHISSCRKDIDNSCFKYDKIVSDNLIVPGLIGQSCKYQNLKEYILSNKEEINNALFANRQSSIDINVLRKKMDASNNQINNKIKSLEYRLSNFITSKYNEVSQKFDGLYEELNKRMIKVTNEVNSNIEERRNELAKLKNFVFEENAKAIENVKSIKEEMVNEFSSLKKKFTSIKKNIVNLTNLLMGRNFNQNRQFVVSNFNNMMLELFKEFGLNHKMNNWDNIASSQRARMSLQGSFISPSSQINKKSTIKTNANSYIKDYIEGKITSDETKYNHGASLLKRKKSFQINDKVLTYFNNDSSQNNKNNNMTNDIINDKQKTNDFNLRLAKSTNINFEKIENNQKIFLDKNKKDIKKELNKDINQLKIEPINKTFIKRNTTNYDNFQNNINTKNEIINEEDSNKYFSSNSNNNSLEENEKEKNEKRKSSINFVKKKAFNMIGNMENRDVKRNNFHAKKKSELEIDLNDKKVIDFSESCSSSSKKMDNNPKNSNKNSINVKLDNINTINSNNSSNKAKQTNKKNSNDLHVINNYTYYNKNFTINSQNLEIKNDKIKEKENYKKISNYSSLDKNKSFKELKTEQSINLNIENKKSDKQNSNANINLSRNNFSQKIKLENIENFSFINKNKEVSNKTFKKNNDLRDIKESMSKGNYIFYSYGNIKKPENEGLQLPSNSLSNLKPRKQSPIIIKSKFTKNSNKIINFSNDNNINPSGNSDYRTKTANSTKKDLSLEKGKKSKDNYSKENDVNKIEVSKQQYSSNKNLNKNNSKDDHYKLKSAQKINKRKLKLNKDNFFKDDKDIYLSKDILKSSRYIKDEEIIDMPLLCDMNVFKIDKNKGNLENRITELEYFTKKKLDELVKEIKIFIPIHFNSHLKNYSLNKNK